MEERLQEDRRKIYADLLDPYIRLFAAADLKKNASKAVQQMVSYDYRKTAFHLVLFGNDEVVGAYNSLMQYTYKAEATGQQDPNEMMRLWGALLLEIRRSLGNKDSSMDEWDMLKWLIKDIETLQSKGQD